MDSSNKGSWMKNLSQKMAAFPESSAGIFCQLCSEGTALLIGKKSI